MLNTDYLDMKAEEINRPLALPAGSYSVQVRDIPAQDRLSSEKGSWKTFDFQLSVLAPQEDVDPDELEEYGDVSGSMVFHRIFITEDDEDKQGKARAVYRLKEFLLACGAFTEDGSIREALPNAAGCQLIVEISQELDKNDPEFVRNRVKRVLPAD